MNRNVEIERRYNIIYKHLMENDKDEYTAYEILDIIEGASKELGMDNKDELLWWLLRIQLDRIRQFVSLSMLENNIHMADEEV